MASGHLKALNIDGVPPERIAVEAGHYRLKGPLILVYRAWNEITMGPFFGFLASREGQHIIGRNLVPVGPDGVRWRDNLRA